MIFCFIFKKLFLRSTHQNDPKHKKKFKKIKKKLIFLKTRVARVFKHSHNFFVFIMVFKFIYIMVSTPTWASTVPSLSTIPTQQSLYIHPSVQATSHAQSNYWCMFFYLDKQYYLGFKVDCKESSYPWVKNIDTVFRRSMRQQKWWWRIRTKGLINETSDSSTKCAFGLASCIKDNFTFTHQL
jgi:hypothetical protein